MSDNALVPHANPLPTLWFGRSPELDPDEKILASYPANRAQGWRAVGGSLHLTTRRVVFRPNAIDARIGGKRWECAHGDIRGVKVQPAGTSFFAWFTMARGDRLRIELVDRSELFVIKRPEERVKELIALLGRDLPTSPAELPEARTIER